MSTSRSLSLSLARRLILTRQRLAGPRPVVTADAVLELIRDLGCLQLDPLNVVARSHLLVLWSRLGDYNPALLDQLLWQEHRLFEYWAHAASIVVTEDYQLYQHRMRASYQGDEIPWSQRAHRWIEQNEVLKEHILTSLREGGPLRARDFTDVAVVPWQSTGWTGGRNVSRMLDFLWSQGQITVAGRKGIDKLWDLSEKVLPDWTPREPLSGYERDSRAAQRALLALGVATARDITEYFTRGYYPGLAEVLVDLEASGQIERVKLHHAGKELPGSWFMHHENLPLLEALEAGQWEPRTTLLSPFDNMICDRRRTALLFDFAYQSEIYLPKAKRRYGYYVLPILHGDQLIGRIDPALDRTRSQLNIHAIHFEASAAMTPEIVQSITGAIEELARFLGATTIQYAESLEMGAVARS
ncbi:MAG TPA: crosslink repair DNA glycosylase YcaQ family protein [Ktedonobacteraceae bacterium]